MHFHDGKLSVNRVQLSHLPFPAAAQIPPPHTHTCFDPERQDARNKMGGGVRLQQEGGSEKVVLRRQK